MNNRFNFILLIFAAALIFCLPISAQEKEKTDGSDPHKLKESANLLFKEIENGISSGKVSAFSRYFSPQIYLSLSNGVSGYYSSNQAYYVLAEYFRLNQAASFAFGNVQEEESGMYAIGSYDYLVKGKRESAQVYVSLKNTGKKWKITQITIN